MTRCQSHRHLPMLTAALATVMIGIFWPAGLAVAQTDAGALRVLVVDESKAVVPGATIEVRNTAKGMPPG